MTGKRMNTFPPSLRTTYPVILDLLFASLDFLADGLPHNRQLRVQNETADFSTRQMPALQTFIMRCLSYYGTMDCQIFIGMPSLSTRVTSIPASRIFSTMSCGASESVTISST